MQSPRRGAAHLVMLAMLVVIPAAACSGGAGGSALPTLKIGVDLPLSGDEGRAAVPALNGISLYVKQHPTLDGFAVTLVPKDDSVGGVAEPPKGVANIEGFIADQQVMAVIGPFDSSVARAEIPAANAASLAMVSPATSSPCLTKPEYLPAALNPSHKAISCKDAGLPSAGDLRPSGVNNYFRLSTTDELQGPAAADYAYKTLHLVRVAAIFDHEAYGQALVASFTTRFTRLGGLVVGTLDFNPSVPTVTTDPTTFLKKVRADGAQAVYYGGVTANKGCEVRALMSGVFAPGEAAPFLGGDGIAEDPACVQSAGANAAGIYATVPVVDANAVGSAGPVIAAFRQAYPNSADYGPYTVIAYDAAAVLYDALDRAIKGAAGRLPPRGNVVSQLSSTSDFAGATGLFGFEAGGDSTRRIVTMFEPAGTDPRAAWKRVGAIDYTAGLPY